MTLKELISEMDSVSVHRISRLLDCDQRTAQDEARRLVQEGLLEEHADNCMLFTVKAKKAAKPVKPAKAEKKVRYDLSSLIADISAIKPRYSSEADMETGFRKMRDQVAELVDQTNAAIAALAKVSRRISITRDQVVLIEYAPNGAAQGGIAIRCKSSRKATPLFEAMRCPTAFGEGWISAQTKRAEKALVWLLGQMRDYATE